MNDKQEDKLLHNKIIDIPINHEYRIETQQTIQIILLEGTGEINGMDLVINKEYNIQTGFIFSYSGCKIQVKSEVNFFGYVSGDTNIPEMLKFANEKIGDWCIKGNGKTTFIKTVMNYGVRLNKKIIVTELNPSGLLFAPGIIGQCYMTEPFREFNMKNMILFYYGKSIEKNDSFHKKICNKIEKINLKYDLNLIISNNEYERVCVLNEERLFYKLNVLEKVYIRKTGGYQKIEKENCIKKYFFNSKYQRFILKCDSKIFKIGEEIETPKTALPIGAVTKLDECSLNEVDVKNGDVIAITFGNENNLFEPIKTFGIIKEIGQQKKIMFCQSKIPTGLFLKTQNVLHTNE